ncbi:MAG: DUF4332 domain-containing protein [Desulfobacterales bacterium]|jgi:predicted flap endonuclease-1-like 5' DNA nuclease
MKKISEIEGIGSNYAARLQQAGIQHVETLIEKCASPQGRMEVAKTADINPKLILRWVNMADLFRVKGIGEEYADLLEAAGVDTIPELGQRKPENLHKKLEEVNLDKKLVRKVPSLAEVSNWIEQAKELPRKVTY